MLLADRLCAAPLSVILVIGAWRILICARLGTRLCGRRPDCFAAQECAGVDLQYIAVFRCVRSADGAADKLIYKLVQFLTGWHYGRWRVHAFRTVSADRSVEL
jgi:hypothetical protein